MEELREDLRRPSPKASSRSSQAPAQSIPKSPSPCLPSSNDSPDEENTYFITGDGGDSLNNRPEKSRRSRVHLRTSVEQYRERKKVRPGRIAEELGVNYYQWSSGSGQKYGTAFKLRGPSDHGAKETHLLGDSFQRRSPKAWKISSMSKRRSQIGRSWPLKAVIAPEEKQLIEKIPTADLGAYDCLPQRQNSPRIKPPRKTLMRPSNILSRPKIEILGLPWPMRV